MKRGSDRNGATQAKRRLGKRERKQRAECVLLDCGFACLYTRTEAVDKYPSPPPSHLFFLFLRNTCTFFLKLKPESAGTTEIYRTGTYAGTETRQFRSGKYTGLPVRFGCTGDLYRISADKFIPYRKKKSVSFSFSPSTGDDLYILDLNSGP